MQLRKIAIICSIAGFLYSGLAAALGLGEITLKSEFNQPLVAEIRLLKVRDLSENQILVSLASSEDFEKAGVDPLFFLSDLRFEVVLNNPSNPHIKVTSRNPVIEPYVNFLVDVQWPSGRLLREYTLLLDLPVFTEGKQASSISPPPASASPQIRPKPQPIARPLRPETRPEASEPRPEPQPLSTSSSPTPSRTVNSYRVRPGDTLWEIAEDVRPDRSLTVTQMMIAIQQNNPDAFIDNNINLLRNGRVLRIPSSDEIAQIDYDEALVSVRQQTQSWSGSSKAVLTSAVPIESPSQSDAQPEGRLTLGSTTGDTGQASGSSSDGIDESLQNELSEAEEELFRAIRENDELRSRVLELESQIGTMEALVEVTNTQLEALRAALAKNQQSEITQSIPPLQEQPEPPVVAEQPEPPVVAEQPEPPVVAEQPEPPVVAEQPEPPTAVQPGSSVASQPSILDILKQNIYFIIGGLLVITGFVFFLIRSRKRSDDVDSDMGEFDFAEDKDDLFVEDETLELDDEDLPTNESFDEMESLEEVEESVEAQTEDVVAESDIYLSLGQEDKAIELLQKEIHQNPDNAEARLGLLKIYAKLQDAAAFDDQYAQLLPLGDSFKNDQATELRNEIEGIEPFDTEQYAPSVTSEIEDEVGGELEEDLLADPAREDLTTSNSDKEQDEGGALEDIGLDLDLDLDSEDAFNFELEESNQDTVATDDDLSLDDLSLDLEGLDSKLDSPEELNLDDNLDIDLDLEEEGEFNFELDEDTDGTVLTNDLELSDASLDMDDLEIEQESGVELDLVDGDDLNLDEISLDLDGFDSELENAEELNLDADDLSLDEVSLELDGLDNELDSSEDLTPTDNLDEVPPELELDEATLNDTLEFDADEDLSFDEIPIDSELDLEFDKELNLDSGLDGSLDSSPGQTELDIAEINEIDDVDFADTEAELGDEEFSLEFDETFEGDDEGKLITSLDADSEPLELNDLDDILDSDLLDLDGPRDDIDIASLDKEIDAMTAELDQELSLGADESSLDLAGIEEPAAEKADVIELESYKASENVVMSEDGASRLVEMDLDMDMPIDNTFDGDELTNPAVLTDELEGLDEVELVDGGLGTTTLEDVTQSDIGAEDSDLADSPDEVAIKLDLAKAYLEIGDTEGADDILAEVIQEGSPAQKDEAISLRPGVANDGLQVTDGQALAVSSSRMEESSPADGFSESTDEVATKLDLAKAYLEIGDSEGAQEILGEVVQESNPQQQEEALELKPDAPQYDLEITESEDLMDSSVREDDSTGVDDLSESVDEVATKLDLAKAYLEIGDSEGAEDILSEVIQEGNPEQKDEALGLRPQAGLESSVENVLAVPSATEEVGAMDDDLLEPLESEDLIVPAVDEIAVTQDADSPDEALKLNSEHLLESEDLTVPPADKLDIPTNLEFQDSSIEEVDLSSGVTEVGADDTLEETSSQQSDEDTVSEPGAEQDGLDQLEDDGLTVSSVDEVEITADDDLDFLEASDEVATKLDLAKAYLDMGDREGAEDILDEVMQEGSPDQKGEAQELMRQM